MPNRPPCELDGLTAVVTGSTSGIGRAVALELASAGAAVLVHGRSSSEAAEAVAEEIRQAGSEAAIVMADLAEPAGQQSLVEQAWVWRGEVDIWMNNAGADVLTGEAAKWSFERKLERLWQVDVTATMRLARLAGLRMKARGQGAIINVGWDQAEFGMAGDSGELFAAVKGAIMAFSRSLARSLAPEVRVNCLAPGWIRTSWGEQASDAWQQRAVAESLLARWGEPEDIARAARFLASPASSFVTGQIININGGFVGETRSKK
ncbi:MAG TPA: SDR family oxidoreductase [Pirellulales bacterium]|nr:SDR family oxidoreductase [Pirellulales bacterium]